MRTVVWKNNGSFCFWDTYIYVYDEMGLVSEKPEWGIDKAGLETDGWECVIDGAELNADRQEYNTG